MQNNQSKKTVTYIKTIKADKLINCDCWLQTVGRAGQVFKSKYRSLTAVTMLRAPSVPSVINFSLISHSFATSRKCWAQPRQSVVPLFYSQLMQKTAESSLYQWNALWCPGSYRSQKSSGPLWEQCPLLAQACSSAVCSLRWRLLSRVGYKRYLLMQRKWLLSVHHLLLC